MMTKVSVEAICAPVKWFVNVNRAEEGQERKAGVEHGGKTGPEEPHNFTCHLMSSEKWVGNVASW